MIDISEYEVGDEFEGSPNELSQMISAILAEGGSFDYEGSSVTITTLPKRPAKTPLTNTEAMAAVKQHNDYITKVAEEPKKEVKEEPKKPEPPLILVNNTIKPEPKDTTMGAVKVGPTTPPKPLGRPKKVVE